MVLSIYVNAHIQYMKRQGALRKYIDNCMCCFLDSIQTRYMYIKQCQVTV